MPLPAGSRPQQAQRQEFDPIAEGVYQVDIVDIDQKDSPKFNNPTETERVWEFQFQILTDGPFKGRRLWKRARPVIAAGDKPSILYQITSRALAAPQMSEDEALARDPNDLIGKQMQVLVA